MEFYKPTLDEILDGRDLTRAEERLLACCKTGEGAIFGNAVPDEASDANQIDAAIIRYLLLGGCEAHRPHPIGVEMMGAYVSGVLNFEGCRTTLALLCLRCKFSDEPNFMDAAVGGLNFIGSHLPGLNGHRMRVERDVLMRNGFNASGEVNLSSANIRGALDCDKGEFDGNGKVALNCDAIQVGAGVFLRNGFKAVGRVDLVCAKIEGNLTCLGADFKGNFVAEGMSVGHTFWWLGITGAQGRINLCDARVGVLVDDVDSWQSADILLLKGFKYDAIDNQFVDFPLSARLDWVEKSHCADHEQPEANKEIVVIERDKERFEPQPYVQLARVYEASGQRGHAAKVREEMERRIRRSDYVAARFGIAGREYLEERRMLARPMAGLNWFFGAVFGYGHAPMRGAFFALLLVLLTSFFYNFVYHAGQFAPNSDIILTSAEWRAFADDPAIANPAAAWSADKAGTDYESFSAVGYGLDLFLPLDALGQEAAWAPSRDRGALGKFGFYLRWFIQFLGWVFTGVLAAALTGIIGRKETG